MSKPNTITVLSDLFAKIGTWSLVHRWWVFATSVLVLLAALWLSAGVRMNNSFDTYFDESDPAYRAYLQYREDFGSDEIAYLLYDASDYEHGVFNLELMQTIASLSDRIEAEVPFVKQVKSISHLEVMLANEEDGIDIIELNHDFPEDQQALLEFAEQFMSKQMYIDGYVSGDRRFGGIRVDMEKSSVDPIDDIRLDPEAGDGLENVYPQVTETALAKILAEPEFSKIHFYNGGDVPINSAYNRVATNSMIVTGSVTLLIVTVLLLYFFRFSMIGVFGPLAIVGLSVVMTMGFMRLMGWDMDMLFGMVPTLLIALGIANAVHIISEFRIYHARYHDRRKAIKETLKLVGAPCLLTSLTTAAGFLAMSVSPIQTIAHFAVYTSLAVIAAFLLSITLLPFFLSFGDSKNTEGIERKNHSPRLDRFLTGIAHFSIRHPRKILLGFCGLLVVAVVGLTKVEIDSNFLLDFSDDVPVRITTEYIDDNMGGSTSLIYLFDTGQEEGIKDPAVLREIERFQAYIGEQDPLVKKTWSIVDLIKDINQSFNGGDPAYYRIPDSRELVAQYLLVYEISGGKELFSFVSQDYSRANLEVRTQLVNSSEIAVLKQLLDDYQQAEPLRASTNTFSGVGALWMQLIDYISISQLQGVTLAFVIISILMCLIFRSFTVGMISMIPNVAPALFIVGLIGWLGVYLDYMKLLIAPIAIGIAVDDTIHMMSRLQYEFKVHCNYQKALVAAMRGVGRALLITSIVLVCGFSAYTLSDMDSQFWFGVLLSATILLALIADFLVMPALILLLKPFGPEEDEVAEDQLTAVDGQLLE